jgi:hypothetical protein
VLIRVVATAFGVAALAGLVGVCWWWGVGFDEAESFGVATPSTDTAMVTSFWIAVVGLAGLVLTGVLAAVSRPRTRS